LNVDYENLESDIASGLFRETLREELILGFRQLRQLGERLPPPSYFAAQIADVVNRGAAESIPSDLAFHLYQEILLAVEAARDEAMRVEPLSS